MISRRAALAAFAATAAAGRSVAYDLASLTPHDQLIHAGRYLPYYLDARTKAEAGEPGYDQVASWLAAIVGDEKEALRFAGPWEMRTEQTIAGDDLRSEDALLAIETAAAKTQIAILNEAHHVSRHRLFAGEVAARLAPMGFTQFGAEAFAPPRDGASYSVRTLRAGSPLSVKSGLYVLDPVYGQTVRSVLRSGMSLFDYEQRPNERVSNPDWKVEVAAREDAQARNVAALLERSPDAKFLIYCGYDHVTEVGDRTGDWFATRLKALTGVDPLTIDQSQSWTRLHPAEDPPHVKAAFETFKISGSVCITDRAGQALTSDAYRGRIDMSVFHPRLDDVNGRPGWLAAAAGRYPLDVPLPAADQIRLLQVFSVDEGWGSLPVDQMVIAPGVSTATLYPPAGDHVVRMETLEGLEMLGRVKVAASE